MNNEKRGELQVQGRGPLYNVHKLLLFIPAPMHSLQYSMSQMTVTIVYNYSKASINYSREKSCVCGKHCGFPGLSGSM